MTTVTHVHRWQIAPADRDNPGGLLSMTRTCPECGGAMTVELLRPDPYDSPVLFLVCLGCWDKYRSECVS